MGGGSSQDTQSSQQQISQVSLPPWINQAAQQNYAQAQNIANQPLTQFQGQQVANIGPQMQQAWNLAASSGGAGADQYNAAQAAYLNTAASTPQQIRAQQAALSQAALAAPTVAAQAALAQAQAAPTVTAQQAALSTLGGMNLAPYMNPYTQDVINKTLPIMNQSLAQQQNALANQANQQNAFGGSRQGIQAGITGAQGAMGEAQMAAQLNAQNFAQAQQAGEFDVGQANNMAQFNAGQTNQVGMFNENQLNQVGLANMQAANQVGMYNAGQQNQVGMYNQGQANAMNQFNAGQANQLAEWNAGAANQAAYQNQQAGLTQEQLANTAASGLAAMGSQAQQNQRQQFLELATAGSQEQQQAQNQINAQMNQFNQANQYPYQQLGVLQSALGMTPYGSTTMGASSGQSQTTTTPSLTSDIFGGLTALGGLVGQGGPFNALMPGSDRALKTDVTKIGVHQPTGLPIYSYRYKGDPKSYPKVSGPMAEDVMQVAPQAVKTVGIHKPSGQAMHGIDMNALDAAGPAIRPRSMPGAQGSFATRVPGALAPASPMGLTGALGANMRAPRLRSQAKMPRVKGAMGGFSGI